MGHTLSPELREPGGSRAGSSLSRSPSSSFGLWDALSSWGGGVEGAGGVMGGGGGRGGGGVHLRVKARADTYSLHLPHSPTLAQVGKGLSGGWLVS